MALSAKGRTVVILVAALISVAIAANLGAWQLRRAAQKIALQDALESRAKLSALTAPELARTPEQVEPQHYRPVQLRGRWLQQRSVFHKPFHHCGWPDLQVCCECNSIIVMR